MKEKVVAYEFGSFAEISEFLEFLSENGIGYYQNGMRVIVSSDVEGECNDFFYMISEAPDIDNLRDIENEEVGEGHTGSVFQPAGAIER